MINKAYKYRIYPTEEQKVTLAKTFGCVRFVYNTALKAKTDAWSNEQRNMTYVQTSALLTEIKAKEEFIWLNEVSSVPLQQSLRNLQTAFKNFFDKRASYPKFKSKHDTYQSAKYVNTAYTFRDGVLKLAKDKEPLDVRWSRQLPKAAKLTSITISKDSSNRYFVSIQVEDEVAKKKKLKTAIGIDLGVESFLATSNGDKVKSINVFRKSQAKLAKYQRRLAKKVKGSSGYQRAKLKVAKVHTKITDVRKDFLHKLSTKLINENQVICLEDLRVSNMVKNRRLSKVISDQGWFEFTRQLQYKADWYGRQVVFVDPFYPSSKRCFECGHVAQRLPLNIRKWTCSACNHEHDRDINASKNILAAGLAVLANGANVRRNPTNVELSNSQ